MYTRRTLLDNGSPHGAYYLTGHAVECALKACIARRTRRHDFPDRRVANEAWQHNLEALLSTAGLRGALANASTTSSALAANWAIVKDWTVDSRYEANITEEGARQLYRAVTRRRNGVMRWVRQHW